MRLKAPKQLINKDILDKLSKNRAFHWVVLVLLIAIVPGGLFFGAIYFSKNLHRKKDKTNDTKPTEQQ